MQANETEPTAVIWLRRADFDLMISALEFVAENADFDAETTTRFGQIYDNLTDSRDRFDGAIEAAPQPADKPKRKRRTKAEIEAANRAADEAAVREHVEAERSAAEPIVGSPVSQAEVIEMAIDAALANPSGQSIQVPSVQRPLPGL